MPAVETLILRHRSRSGENFFEGLFAEKLKPQMNTDERR